MRVLYLTNNPYRLSTTAPTEGWFRFLRAKGLQPVLVSREVGAFHEWAGEQGIPAFQNPLPLPDKWNPVPFGRAVWHLRTIAKKWGIQLIHCNEQDIYPIGRYLGRLCRLPVVVSVHFRMERGYCEWAFGRLPQPQRMFFVSRRNLEACAPALDGVVPESHWRVLHNGLDLGHYQPDHELRAKFRREHSIGTAKLIGVACALRPRKQLEHLFEAATHLPREVRVAVAGGPVRGDEDYARDLLAQAGARLGDRLITTGHLGDLRGFCNALDLFVNTSSEEACPIGPLEAMACGCPVVGYDSKAVDELVLPDGGEIVAQDDIGQLVAALNGWLGDPPRLAAARPRARCQAGQFDIRRLSEQLWSEYQEIVSTGLTRQNSTALQA